MLAILAGTYVCPESCSDSTVLLVEEIKRVASLVRDGSVHLEITGEELKENWKAMNEYTSSSRSGINFSHWKAVAQVEQLASFFAKTISFIARTGCASDR